jgi:hypothetical protein
MMPIILISHRGNIIGSQPEKENHPDYIQDAILFGYDVEIDIWFHDNKLYLGHDEPQYPIKLNWLKERIDKLWVHCKNHDALMYFNELEDSGISEFNYFWHQEDDITLTSMNFMWVYPGKQPIRKSIAVMPEMYEDDISECIGICSDFIENYKYLNK